MAGIAGFIGKGFGADNAARLQSMVRRMVHEPFEHPGTFAEESSGLWAGWVSQAGSFSDGLPIWNENRDVALIFWGEDFRPRAEIDALRARGHSFSPEGAGYLVHLYEELGPRFFEQLNGGFAGLVVDLRHKRVHLFNDRYGLNRIYFHENELGLFFASEAKALLQVLPALRQIDQAGFGEYFSCGCALQNRTLFAGVSLLPGATLWTFEAGRAPARQVYFRKEQWEQLPPLGRDEFHTRLKETWSRVLPLYFRNTERLGLSLTGGVDSRMVLAWLPESAGEVKCYTFGGPYRECRDVKLAREVARICRQPHQVIPVTDDFLRSFPSLAEKTVYLSDGAMDVTGAVDLYVQRVARNIAPVRVTGTNGGEMLRRLVAFKPTGHGQSFLQGNWREAAQAAAATYFQELQGHKLSFTAFKQTPWYMCSKFSVERSQLSLRMPYFDNEIVALSYQAPLDLAESNEPALWLIAQGNPALSSVGTDRGLALRAVPGLMQLRHQYEQFTFKAEYAYDYGMPQWLARLDHCFSALHLERLWLGRHKFHHFRVYYRDHWAEYVREVLLDPRTRSRPYLQGHRLEEMVAGHLGGHRNYTLEIHKILSSELIQRQLLEADYSN